MNIKSCNEITVKVTTSKEELIKVLKEKGFKYIREFSLDDYYFVPNKLDIKSLSPREILAKCLIVRNIFDEGKYKKKITYKIKEINNIGEIINQKAINCDIYDIDQAKNLLEAIGYYQIMNIKEDDLVYKKGDLELSIKDIKDGDILIEVEVDENTEFNTIDKIKKVVQNLEIPIVKNEFFVKKAEIELGKIL